MTLPVEQSWIVYPITIIGILILVLLQGFFSGSEIALVHCDKGKLRYMAKSGDNGSKLALKMLERPEVVLTTTLVGTNVALVLITVLGTMLLVGLLGPAGDLLTILLFTPLSLIIGEVVPKSIFQQESDKLTPKIIYPLYLLSLILFPIVFLFSRIARLASRVIGRGKAGPNIFTVREQLRAVLEIAEGASPDSPFDSMRIRNVVRFGELSAGDLMVPAAEMTAISSSKGIADAIDLVRKSGYTHLPVYEGRRNNVCGIASLTAWNLVDSEAKDRDLTSLIKSAYFVPALQPVAELLPILRSRDDQTAIVVDEYGSAIGLITVDTILESIVGNIEAGLEFRERNNVSKPSYQKLDDDTYLIDARLPISDVNDVLATKISTAMAHTLGGFLVFRLRHVPKVGEFLDEDGFRFTVEEATDRSAIKVRVSRIG